MLLTVDSNVPNLAKLTAESFPEGATKRWCSDFDECSIDGTRADASDEGLRYSYDTPIAYANATDYETLRDPKKSINVVYMDHRYANKALKVIGDNVKRLRDKPNTLIVSNANSVADGRYRLKTDRCTMTAVAKSLATIAFAYAATGVALSPEKLYSTNLSDLRDNASCVDDRDDNAMNMQFDVKRFSEWSQDGQRRREKDCVSCEL